MITVINKAKKCMEALDAAYGIIVELLSMLVFNSYVQCNAALNNTDIGTLLYWWSSLPSCITHVQ